MFTCSDFLDHGHCLLLRLLLQHLFIELSFHHCPISPETFLKSILSAPESISEAHHVKGATFLRPALVSTTTTCVFNAWHYISSVIQWQALNLAQTPAVTRLQKRRPGYERALQVLQQHTFNTTAPFYCENNHGESQFLTARSSCLGITPHKAQAYGLVLTSQKQDPNP